MLYCDHISKDTSQHTRLNTVSPVTVFRQLTHLHLPMTVVHNCQNKVPGVAVFCDNIASHLATD